VPLDGFIGPAHVSTVIGSRPYEFFAEEYRKPVVIAGFEPLDVMQAILMLVRQVNEGRAEVENEFSRAVTRDGNLKAQDRSPRCSNCAAVRMARPGVVPYSALRIRQRYAELRRRAALQSRLPLGAGQQGLRVRRHPARRQAAAGLQDLRHGVHAENPIGSCMVFRRRLRRALQLWTLQGHALNMKIRRDYVRPLDLKHGRVDMTHGAGGRAMVQLISELFARHLGNEYLAQGNDGAVLPAPTFGEAGTPGDGHRQPRGLAAVLSPAATSAACRCMARSTTSR
jgi:hypothetical protein